MSLIPELEAELEATVARQPRAEVVRRGVRRLVPIMAVAGLAVTTAALAAGGVIPIGSPVKDPGAGQRRPDVGMGTVVPGTVKLLALRVADPDGGPPWGMRVVSTTRGLGCLQIGRVVDGRLGVLGQDGVFANDGRFHPLPTAAVGPGACAELDAGKRLFTNAVVGGIPAAGTGDGACAPPATTTGVPASRLCAEADERQLSFGTLGPQAQSVSYRALDGTEQTVDTAAPFGAYLIVEHRDPAHRFDGMTSGALAPSNSPITELRFTTGLTCAVTPAGFAAGPDSCPLPGYRPRPVAQLTAADVKTPVHAHAIRTGKSYTIVVSFRARVAVTDAASAYNIVRHAPGRHASYAVGTTGRNIAKGSVVTYRFPFQKGHGTYTGSVTFQPTHSFPLGGAGGLEVGRWSVRLP